MFLDLAYHIVFLHIVPDFTDCSGVHICVLLYICKKPSMDRNYCVIVFIEYKSCSDTQKVANVV